MVQGSNWSAPESSARQPWSWRKRLSISKRTGYRCLEFKDVLKTAMGARGKVDLFLDSVSISWNFRIQILVWGEDCAWVCLNFASTTISPSTRKIFSLSIAGAEEALRWAMEAQEEFKATKICRIHPKIMGLGMGRMVSHTGIANRQWMLLLRMWQLISCESWWW
jgi:hypothetical protein